MKLRRDRAPEPEPQASPPPGAHLLYQDGLLAPWYIARRLDEELARAHRSGRPLAVLIAVPQLLPDEALPLAAREAAAAAAMRATRRYDLIGWLGTGRIVVIMPDADGAEAASAADRLANEMFRCSAGAGGHKWLTASIFDARAFDTSIALLANIDNRAA